MSITSHVIACFNSRLEVSFQFKDQHHVIRQALQWSGARIAVSLTSNSQKTHVTYRPMIHVLSLTKTRSPPILQHRDLFTCTAMIFKSAFASQMKLKSRVCQSEKVKAPMWSWTSVYLTLKWRPNWTGKRCIFMNPPQQKELININRALYVMTIRTDFCFSVGPINSWPLNRPAFRLVFLGPQPPTQPCNQFLQARNIVEWPVASGFQVLGMCVMGGECTPWGGEAGWQVALVEVTV